MNPLKDIQKYAIMKIEEDIERAEIAIQLFKNSLLQRKQLERKLNELKNKLNLYKSIDMENIGSHNKIVS